AIHSAGDYHSCQSRRAKMFPLAMPPTKEQVLKVTDPTGPQNRHRQSPPHPHPLLPPPAQTTPSKCKVVTSAVLHASSQRLRTRRHPTMTTTSSLSSHLPGLEGKIN